MQQLSGVAVLCMALLTGVQCSTLRGELRITEERPHLVGKWPMGHNSMRFHLQEQIQQEEAKLKRMESAAIKPAWMIPPNPHEDRLNDDYCKEPKPYVKTDYAGAFGPEKIYCCRTVRQVIQDVKYRCNVECNDAHPCHQSMKDTFCPKYLAAYERMEAVLCKARPTTTTTITTTTTTTTLPLCVDGDFSPSYPCRCGADNNICQNNEICDHSDGTCTHQLPLCPNGTESPNYPCQCGAWKLRSTCNSTADCDEVCTDWETGKCECIHKKTDWCVELCVKKMKAHMKFGRNGTDEDCAKAAEAQVADASRPGCEELCEEMHYMGALRPEEEHAQYAKEPPKEEEE